MQNIYATNNVLHPYQQLVQNFGFNAHISLDPLLMRNNFGKGNITNKNKIDKLKAQGQANSAIHNSMKSWIRRSQTVEPL